MRRLEQLADRVFSYPEVGATQNPLPDGYRHIRRTEVLGTGTDTFHRAGAALDRWAVHRGAGLQVLCTGPATQPGVDVILLLGARWLHVTAACRVVYVIREPHRHGFAYGTLEGHPESGEESFVVDIQPDDQVSFSITAFSRPRSRSARAARPLTHAVQEMMTCRYLAAMRRLIGQHGGQA